MSEDHLYELQKHISSLHVIASETKELNDQTLKSIIGLLIPILEKVISVISDKYIVIRDFMQLMRKSLEALYNTLP